jgi:hypothetical protein
MCVAKSERRFVTTLPYLRAPGVHVVNSEPFEAAFGNLDHNIVRCRQTRLKQAVACTSASIGVHPVFLTHEAIRERVTT